MAKIILITHQKGGVGKSTLTFNLAQNFSNNSNVAVLDFDLQGSLSQLKEIVSDFDVIPFVEEINSISNLNYDFIFIDTPPYLSNHLFANSNFTPKIRITKSDSIYSDKVQSHRYD